MLPCSDSRRGLKVHGYTLQNARWMVPAMTVNLLERFAPLLMPLFPLVEPLAPSFVSYYLGRYLEKWKNQGLIIDYTLNSRRLGKLHYKVVVDLDLTPKQARELMIKNVSQLLKRR